MTRVIPLLLVALASSCPRRDPIQPPPGPDGPPAADPVLDGGVGCSLCASPCECACCAMASYNADGVVRCREAEPTFFGRTCTEVCLETVLFPGGGGLPTGCITRARGLGELSTLCHVCR